MTHVLVISNRKGGVGKTTSTLNIGACLSNMGKKVLLIDLDPQANLTQCLIEQPPIHTIFPLVLQECSYEDTLCRVPSGMTLLPAASSFSRFERHFSHKADALHVVRDLLKNIPPSFSFDYILLDCPPGLSLITVNAFVAGQNVYIPMEAQRFSYAGILQMTEEIKKIRKKSNPYLTLRGLFFCCYNARTRLSKRMKESLQKTFEKVLMKHYIRQDISLGESPSFYQDIFSYDPNSRGAKDYEALTAEVLSNHEEN